jgi:oligopeptide transport system substrate-binding protein
MVRTGTILLTVGMALMAGCSDSWNNPYPGSEPDANVLYSAFAERPKHLDPARSYSSNEVEFTGQIYEPPLQYHFLKRPYTLIPLTAEAAPKPQYLVSAG